MLDLYINVSATEHTNRNVDKHFHFYNFESWFYLYTMLQDATMFWRIIVQGESFIITYKPTLRGE